MTRRAWADLVGLPEPWQSRRAGLSGDKLAAFERVVAVAREMWAAGLDQIVAHRKQELLGVSRPLRLR